MPLEIPKGRGVSMAIGCSGRFLGLTALGVAVMVGVSFPAFAGSAGVDGTDYVVSAESGETYTISTSIGNYARLVKRGAGEVKLTAAAMSFTGSVVVEEGTLSFTRIDALGDPSSVIVWTGATFYFKTPHGSTFNTHKLTIAGDGVDGKGAIRYLPSNGAYNDDNMLGAIELAGDATIECDYRWGVNGEITLNGYRLRRICNDTTNGQWLLNGAKVSGPGTVELGGAQVVFQMDVDSSADVTYVVTNSSIVALWETKRTIPSAFKCFAGTKILSGSGTNYISGPIQLSNHAGATKDGYVTFDASAPRVLILDGPITSDDSMAYNTANNGSLFLNGDVSVSKWVYVNGGTHLSMMSTASRVYSGGFSVNVGGAVSIGGGNTLFDRLGVGTDANRQGALCQTGGVLGVMRDAYVGNQALSVGHWAMSGGEANMSNGVFIANSADSFGSFIQTGGLFKLDGGNLYAGNVGSSVFHVGGGTNDTRVTQDGQGTRFRIGEGGGPSDVTVSGEGTLLATETLRFGGSGAASTNVFSMKDGATVKAARFLKHLSAATGTLVTVSADDATMMPTLGYGWTGLAYGDARYFSSKPDHFVIWEKGLVIDTSESTGAHPESYIPFSFESPSGKGVESIALPTEGDYTNSVYIGLARIVFEDETGWGASAYAEYDFNSNKLTKVVVTSRGCNYSDNAKAYVESPDRATRYECALALSDNVGMGGELVKRGEHALYLHATNTITGGIAVESGTLYAETTGVVPTNTPVRVEYGATLEYANHAPLLLSSFAGAGRVPGCDITVANSLRATCEDLFAGKHAEFDGNLTFEPGATFTITDPENLVAYKRSRSVTAFAALHVNGEPTLSFEGKLAGSTRWNLSRVNDTTFKFGPNVATVIVLR